MTAHRLAVFYLVSQVCLSNGILSAKAPRDAKPMTGVQFPRHGYLPPATGALPKQLQRDTSSNQAVDNGLQGRPSTRRRLALDERPATGYAYSKPSEIQLPLKDQIMKLLANQGSSKEPERVKTSAATSAGGSGRPGLKYHPQVPVRSSYQVVEEPDEYLTDDSDHGESPHRGKAQTTYPHRDSQDITTAIKALDHFLSGVLNEDGYNSELHPPPNPVLALVLSRYGRYVPRARKPRVYAYTAVNNLHNNQPFGKYKLECEEEPRYGDR